MGDKIFIILYHFGLFRIFSCCRVCNDGSFSSGRLYKNEKGIEDLVPGVFGNPHCGLSPVGGNEPFYRGRSAPSRRNKQRNFSSALLCYYCCLCLCMAY